MNNRDEMNLIGRSMGFALTSRVLGWQFAGTAFAAVFATVLWALAQDKEPAIMFLIASIGFIGAYTFLFGTSVVVVRLVSTKAEDKQDQDSSPLHFVVDTLGQSLLLPILIALAGVVTAGAICGASALWQWDIWQNILVIPAAVFFLVVFGIAAIIFAAAFIVPTLLCVEQPGLQELVRRAHYVFRYRAFESLKAVFLGFAAGLFVAFPLALATKVVHNIFIWLYDISSGVPVNDFAAFILSIEYCLIVVTPIVSAALAVISSTAYCSYENIIGDEAPEEPRDSFEDELKIESPEGVTVPQEQLSDV